jgi:hypothetical protein
MSRTTHRRLKKLEAPLNGQPVVHFFEGPWDMSLETASELLKIKIEPGELTFYLGILKPGERPRNGSITVSDEDWELGKNYPRYVEPWPEYVPPDVES